MPFDGSDGRLVLAWQPQSVKRYQDEDPETFKMETFISWLKTKDPAEEYRFADCSGGCLLGQYLAARGYPWQESGCARYLTMALTTGLIAVQEPQTFGGALERARKVLKLKTMEVLLDAV